MGRETQVETLKNEIANGQVVVVAGTGVSVAACGNQEIEGFKVATWTGLLHHGVKHLIDIGAATPKVADILKSQVNSGEIDLIIMAAEAISQRMRDKSDGTYRGWLKDTVGKLTIQNSSMLDSLAALPCVLATLNYDNLLEDATGRRAITWLKPDAVQDLLRGSITDTILHLHGWYEEPESVVLGLGSYTTVREHPHANSVLKLLTTDRTLLFVGCGDTVFDPNFTRLIEWAEQAHTDVVPRHHLLCRRTELDEYRLKLARAPWLQPLDYGADYSSLAQFLSALVPVPGRATTRRSDALLLHREPVGVGFDLAGYQHAMRKRYNRLKLEDLDPSSHDIQPLTLTGMFIPQSARECAEFMPQIFELPKEVLRRLRERGELESSELDNELIAQHRRAYLDLSPRPILDIIHSPEIQRFVILGDPGSGKSTLLQFLLLEWARNPAPDLDTASVPILIELREYARLRHASQTDGFLEYLHSGASVRWHLGREQLHAWLQNHPSRILFDGLDEVFDPDLRREVSTAIQRFADEYPRAQVIVTSRIFGYQHAVWRDEKFRHFMLQELDESQITDFLDRWHRGAYEEAARGESKRALLARALEDSTAIRQLAGNPLLLTMMAILNRTQDLPRDRAELYEQCARLLLHQWKVDAAFDTDPELAKASLDYKDKRRLLMRVAHVMHSSGGGLAVNLIDEDTLESALTEGLHSMPGLRPERAARALIGQLRGRNFMLCSVGAGSYAFVHRTFLEYFCAAEILERFQTEQSLNFEQLKSDIFGHWVDETWHEVLSLLAGMLSPKFVKEILEWLLALPDHTEEHRRVFLAAQCIGEVRRLDELGRLEQEVLARAKALAGFELHYHYDSWDEDAQTVHSIRSRAIQTVARDWRKSADTRDWLKALALSNGDQNVRLTVVQELARGWKDDPDTLPWLEALIESDESYEIRWMAVDAIANGWKNETSILPWLSAFVKSGKDSTVRWRVVQAIARGWKNDSNTHPLLKTLGESDPDWMVRYGATIELALGWKNNPDTLIDLKARAMSNDSNERGIAVLALARGCESDPDTLPLLQAFVQSNAHWMVRHLALSELTFGWKNDPDTLPILKARVQSDEDAAVRQSAVQELARGWKDDPDTFLILMARAHADEDAAVRWRALQELARGWKDDPNTLPILKVLAQSDSDSVVRQVALQELARGWKEDPDTLSILKVLAQSDTDPVVRQVALKELARGLRHDSGTLPWLKAIALSDEHWAVRQSAMRELVRGWKNDPDSLPILMALAQSDEDVFVRRSALEVLERGWIADLEILKFVEDLRTRLS